jgi:capsular exopolysaccharide synthesis family protein
MSSPGVLAEPVKKIVERNSRELSSIDANMMGVVGNNAINSILITSCSAKEGKTVSSVSMATALSNKAGVKVVLVDANLQMPTLHNVFGINSSPGLSDMILSDAELEKSIYPTEYENLSVIPFGTEPKEKKLAIFETDKFKNIILCLKEQFDYVLVDGPAVFASPAITLMAKHFDGILFVIECEKTRWEVLQEATKKLKSVGGNIFGVVMNKRKYYIPRWFYGF